MVTDDIWVLIGKKLSGEATAQELQALERFFSDTANTHIIAHLEQMWQMPDAETTQNPTEEIDKRWNIFRRKLLPDSQAPIRLNSGRKIKTK